MQLIMTMMDHLRMMNVMIILKILKPNQKIPMRMCKVRVQVQAVRLRLKVQTFLTPVERMEIAFTMTKRSVNELEVSSMHTHF